MKERERNFYLSHCYFRSLLPSAEPNSNEHFFGNTRLLISHSFAYVYLERIWALPYVTGNWSGSSGDSLECDVDMKYADGQWLGLTFWGQLTDDRYWWLQSDLFLFLKDSVFRKIMSDGNFCPPWAVRGLSSILSKISEDSWEELLCHSDLWILFPSDVLILFFFFPWQLPSFLSWVLSGWNRTLPSLFPQRTS